MAWQLLAIWLIGIPTIIWFLRDERRLRAEARLAAAARYYAHAPKYRFGPRSVAPQPVPPKPRNTSLLRNDRAYFASLIAKRQRP